MTAFGGPDGYFSLAIIAFGPFQFIVPKYYYRLGKMENLRSLASLFKEVAVFKVCRKCNKPQENVKDGPFGAPMCYSPFLEEFLKF